MQDDCGGLLQFLLAAVEFGVFVTGLLMATHNYCFAVCRSGSAAWSSIVKQTKIKCECAYGPDVYSLPNQSFILKSFTHNYMRGEYAFPDSSFPPLTFVCFKSLLSQQSDKS